MLALLWMSASACSVGDEGGCLGLCESGADGLETGAGEPDAGGSEGAATTGGADGAEDAGTTSSALDDDSGGVHFDLGGQDLPADEPCEGERCQCTFTHVPCDAETEDPFAAMGVNCPGELQLDTSSIGATGPYDYFGIGVDTPSGSIGTRSSFGGTDTFDPREGQSYAVIGSGFVSSLSLEPIPAELEGMFQACNSDLGYEFDPPTPPDPIDYPAIDCEADPTLVGTGDCSGTLQAQFEQIAGYFDWTQLEIGGVVPGGATSLSFDFAFFTYEYPEYFGSQFNDMFVGWLESESWTGNVAFDGNGKPITLNVGFLDIKDANYDAPEFAGTCMQGHAGTNWLTTSVGMTPGEDFRLAFAIFDSSDSALDSYAFIDNVSWGCEDVGGPTTEPAG